MDSRSRRGNRRNRYRPSSFAGRGKTGRAVPRRRRPAKPEPPGRSISGAASLRAGIHRPGGHHPRLLLAPSPERLTDAQVETKPVPDARLHFRLRLAQFAHGVNVFRTGQIFDGRIDLVSHIKPNSANEGLKSQPNTRSYAEIGRTNVANPENLLLLIGREDLAHVEKNRPFPGWPEQRERREERHIGRQLTDADCRPHAETLA